MSRALNPTVFLSYARGDDERFVRRLHDDLEAAGFDAWFDRVDMPQRPLTFHQEIEDAIRERDRVIYIAGPAAAASDYLRQEWRFALALDRPVLPLLRIGDFEDVLPGQLALTHCEDFRDDAEYEARLNRLIVNLRQPEPPLGHLKGVPSLPRTFLARPHLMRRVKEALLVDLQRPVVVTGAAATAEDQGDAPQQIGVQGMGGIGKSVLAAALARDRGVRRAYPEGVVWIRMGLQPNVTALMREFATQVACMEPFSTVPEGKGVLRRFCADKAMLLVLDGAWDARDVEPFDVLGPRCRILITTRDAGILRTLQGELFQVELLSGAQALELLAATAGIKLASLPREAGEIARETGCLPLALALAGGMLTRRTDEQNAWRNVLERIRRARLEELRDRHAIDPLHQSIWHSIAASVDVLKDDQRRRFAELSVFLSNRRTPESAVATLWEHTGDLDYLKTDALLSELADRSLLRLDDDGPSGRGVELHALLHAFASRLAGEQEALHQTLLVAYRQKCSGSWHTGPNDGYFFQNLAYHMTKAGWHEEARRILLDVQWLHAKNERTGPNAVIDDYALLNTSTDDLCWLVKDAIQLSAHITSKSPVEFSGQLFARLIATRETSVRSLLDQFAALNSPWIKSLVPSLPPPCGPLRRTIRADMRRISSVCLMPDQSHLIVGDHKGLIKILSLEEGQVVRSLDAHTHRIVAIAPLPGGHEFVTSALNGDLYRWDSYTGERSRRYPNSGRILLCLLPNTEHACMRTEDGPLEIFDLASAVVSRRLSSETAGLGHVHILPDSGYGIGINDAQELVIFDLLEGRFLQTIGGHPTAITALAVQPDGRRVLTIGFKGDMMLRLWDLASKNLVAKWLYNWCGINDLAILPGGRRALAAAHDHKLKVFDLETGKVLASLDGHNDVLDHVIAFEDGAGAVTVARDAIVNRWRIDRIAKGRFLGNHDLAGDAMAVLRDGRRAITKWEGNSIRIWDLDAAEPVRTWQAHEKAITDLAVSPNGKLALTCNGDDKDIPVWDIGSGRQVGLLKGHSAYVAGIAVFPDGQRAMSVAGDQTSRIWDLRSGKAIRVLEEHPDVLLQQVRPLPMGVLAASISWDYVRIWDTVAGKSVFTLHRWCEGQGVHMFQNLAVHPSGQFIASADYGGEDVSVWDLATHRRVHVLQGTGERAQGVDFTSDGRHIATGCRGGTVRLWELESGRKTLSFDGHSTEVAAVVCLGNNYIVSAARQGEVAVWSPRSTAAVARFSIDSEVWGCHIDSDGSTIVVQGGGGDVHLLRLALS